MLMDYTESKGQAQEVSAEDKDSLATGPRAMCVLLCQRKKKGFTFCPCPEAL